MQGRKRLGGIIAAAALLAAACSSPAATTAAGTAGPSPEPGATTTVAISSDGATTPQQPPSCDATPDLAGGDPQPWHTDVTVEATAFQEPGADGPGIRAVVYPHPDYRGKPWSQWGQGVVLADGRFLSAIGDHFGADGNSFIYEYDPATSTLVQIADVLSLVDHTAGEWGYGKIHAQMVELGCGEVYLSTYWGSRRNLTYTDEYQGDLLFRLDPAGRTSAEVGVILPEHGVASMAGWSHGGLLYAEAADPFGQKTGSFVVLDAATGGQVFEDADDAHGGYRAVAVDAAGRAYITWNETSLARYDPDTNTLTPLDVTMPGGILRAVTVPDANGTIFAATRDPAVFFSLTEDGTITELGPARGYTTSIALSPDGSRFYYVPDAHGGAWREGTPLIAVDTTTGEEAVIAELQPIVGEALGLKLGGTYNVAVDESGSRIYVGLNAGELAGGESFGEVVLVVVTLP